MFKLLVVLSVSLCVAYAAVSVGPLEPKPEKFKNREGCYLKNLDTVIPFGSSMPSKTSCMEIACVATNVIYVTCGAMVAEPPCKIVEDKGKPFPQCCPLVLCP